MPKPTRRPTRPPDGDDPPGLRWQWLAAIGIAVVYALVSNAPKLVMAVQVGSQPVMRALVQTAGTVGFALIATGATLDFAVGLVESFRDGMAHDHE